MLKNDNRKDNEGGKPSSVIQEYTAVREMFGEFLTARLSCLPQGVQVSLYGGNLPHIGAVSIVAPDGKVTTTEFPGHRDGVISEKWAISLAALGQCPAVVVVGIHYDHISKVQIGKIVEVTDAMLAELREKAL